MGQLTFLLLLAIAALLTTPSLAIHKYKMLFGRPMHGFVLQDYSVDEVRKMMADGVTSLKSGNYTQTLNHNAKSTDPDYSLKFQQRFFLNDDYYKEKGPEFLYIGGEAPLSGGILIVNEERTYPMMEWAKQLNARVWALEHRFYGNSRPFEQQKDEYLKYLHSEQALDDLAEFIKAKNNELGLTDAKWIVFGGSYPGALALWFKQKYKDLIVGAVGSSAPIEPRLDFYDYLRVCEDAYVDETYGSKLCAESIKNEFQAVVNLMDYKEGRDYLDDTFSLYPRLADQVLTDQNLANFYSNLIGYFQGVVQYNNRGVYKNGAGIPAVCSRMVYSSYSLISGLTNTSHYMTEIYGTSFDKLFDSYDSMIELLRDPNYYDDGSLAAARSWTWQTCNEFGYFQTTDIGYSIFGDIVPNSFYINMCMDVFGPQYGYDYVKSKVRETVKRYGGRKNYNAQNVVAPNGNIDPWNALGLKKDDTPNQDANHVVPILIPGTSHCADMDPKLPTDPPELTTARNTIFKNIKQWLGIATDAESNNSKRFKRSILNKTSDLNGEKKVGHQFDDPLYTTEQFAQLVDHSLGPRGATFQQTLYRVNKFSKDATSPLIVFVLFDESIDTFVVDDNSPILAMAKEINAGVLFVRSRYFGESKLPGDLKQNNLKYLTLNQIIEDVKAIIDGQQGRDANAKTILVGSGLGGTIAALYRKKYPNSVVGALASSSPIDFQFTYPDGIETISLSFMELDAKCTAGVYLLSETIHELLQTPENRKLLVSTGIACADGLPDTNYVDPMNKATFKYGFISQILKVATFANQDRADGVISLDKFCQLVTDTKTNIMQKLKRLTPGECFPTDYKNAFLKPYLVDTYTQAEDNNLRVKAYLQCNEIGFLLNTDFGINIFTNLVSPNFLINVCTDLFGFTHDEMHAKIEATKADFGDADAFDGTNVIFSYGSFDLNNAASFHGDSNGQDRAQLLIPNAGLSNDLIVNVNTEEATQTRRQILDYFKTWLQ